MHHKKPANPPPPPPPRKNPSNSSILDRLFPFQARPAGSERSFGLTVGAVLSAIGSARIGLSVLGGGPASIDVWTAGLGAGGASLIVLALAHPAWLALPNLLWHRLGLLLARVVTPVVLLLLYATCIVPIGLPMRLCGYDPLRLKRDETADTYWVTHEPSPLSEPMRHQF